jgi:hypothetical protein
MTSIQPAALIKFFSVPDVLRRRCTNRELAPLGETSELNRAARDSPRAGRLTTRTFAR